MKIYLDDDSAEHQLVQLLQKDGHGVTFPAHAGTSGAKDPVHFMYAIRQGLVLLTRNHGDFKLLMSSCCWSADIIPAS